jgi:acetyl-CoA carboxylase alpha subunit
MNPPDLLKLGIIDGIIPEPKGGAHRDWNLAAELLRKELDTRLDALIKTFKKSPKKTSTDRLQKFRTMGEAAMAHAPVHPGT